MKHWDTCGFLNLYRDQLFWSMFGGWKQDNLGGEPQKGTDHKGNVGDPKLLGPRDKYFRIDFPIYHVKCMVNTPVPLILLFCWSTLLARRVVQNSFFNSPKMWTWRNLGRASCSAWLKPVSKLEGLHKPFERSLLHKHNFQCCTFFWSNGMSFNNGLTLPETNMFVLKLGHPKRIFIFQPSIFRGHVSFREGNLGLVNYCPLPRWCITNHECLSSPLTGGL